MDLTGYGYKRGQQTKSATSAASAAFALNGGAELSGEALRLLVALDTKVALQELPARFPRILNWIATVWPRPSEAERYFDDLLLDERGSRNGFSQPVISELTALRHYYLSRVFPKKRDPWEEMHLR